MREFMKECVAGLAGGPPLGFKANASLILSVADQETESVDQDLRPEVYTPGSQEDATEPGTESKQEPKGESSGDIEDEEIKKDLRTGD
jgi:hypothetical protein